MRYEAVIFDWDGTIGMTLHLWLQGYRESLDLQNHPLPDADIVAHLFNQHDMARARYPHVDFEALIENARDFVHDNLPNLGLYPGARETLEALQKRGTPLALVSSSNRQLITAALSILGLESYFSFIMGGDEVTFRKPHPEAFLTSVTALKSDPRQTLIIGDAPTDVAAGKAAKLQTCLFTPPENRPFYDFEVLHGSEPDYAIDALPKLLHSS